MLVRVGAVSMDLRQITTLLVFFITYVVIGGVVFMTLEAPNELAEKHMIHQATIRFREGLEALQLTPTKSDNLTQIINDFLKSQSVTDLNETPQEPRLASQWDFFNSFFFAITVVTTIGYGHMSPSTPTGRLFCLVYALFGIPMTGILLGAIGERFSRCFLDKIHRVRQRQMTPYGIRLIILKRGLFFFVPWFVVFLVTPALVFKYLEEWTFVESFYYCFVTLSTIGFGDFVAGQFDGEYVWLYKIVVVLWIIFGLAYLSMILNFISQGLRSHKLTHVVHNLPQSIRRISGPNGHSIKHNGTRHQRQRAAEYNKNSTLSLPNGRVMSHLSITDSPSPSPSPSLPPYTPVFDTCSNNSSQPRRQRKPLLRRLCKSFIRTKKKRTVMPVMHKQECNQLLKYDRSPPKVTVVDNEETKNESTDNRNSLSSGATTMTSCSSPLPLTRAELSTGRKVFFQELDHRPECPVTAV
ncbi:Potassium channel subfamily K member 10 [Halotydeus destructor]|nr:Potassium channel subfamily K member 10 [Halotydeus destructor]